jgi:hypothetical protein
MASNEIMIVQGTGRDLSSNNFLTSVMVIFGEGETVCMQTVKVLY